MPCGVVVRMTRHDTVCGDSIAATQSGDCVAAAVAARNVHVVPFPETRATFGSRKQELTVALVVDVAAVAARSAHVVSSPEGSHPA